MKNNSTGIEAFLGALIGSFFGTLANQWIRTPEDFKRVCEILDKKLKEHKSIEQMTIDELKQVLQKSVSEENYEKATEIKKLINYKSGSQK